MTGAGTVERGDLLRRQRFSPASFAWRSRIATGLPAYTRHTLQSGIPNRAGTVANIWRKHGIEPAPERERKTTWKEFLRRHWKLIAAANFFTVEVWTHCGLRRFL